LIVEDGAGHSPHALPGQLGDDGVVSRSDGAGAEGEGVSLEAVVADFVAPNPQRKETGFDVVGDGVALDGSGDCGADARQG
jgi:hypothetical protein